MPTDNRYILEDSKFTIPLISGIDTGVDPKLVPSPSLLRAENVEMIKRGKLQKRNKLTALGTTVLDTGGATIGSIRSFASRFSQLLAHFSDYVYAYIKASDKWKVVGNFIPLTVTVRSVSKNIYEQTYPDMCIAGNLALFAWEDNRDGGGIYASIQDIETEAFTISDYNIDTGGTHPRCIKVENYTESILIFAESSIIKMLAVTLSSHTFGSVTNVKTDLKAANPNYDVWSLGTTALLAYNVTGTNKIQVCTVSSGLSATDRFSVNETGDTCVCIFSTTDFASAVYIFLLWYDGTNVRCAIYNSSYSQVVAPFTVEAIADVKKITGIQIQQSPYTTARILYEISDSDVYNYRIRTCTIDIAGNVSTPEYMARGVGLVSKAFNRYGATGAVAGASTGTSGGGIGQAGIPNIDCYALCVYDSSLQGTYFVLRQDGAVAAKIQYGKAGGVRTKNIAASVTGLNGLVYVACPTKNELKQVNDFSFLSNSGTSYIRLSFDDTQAFDGITAGSEFIGVGGRVSVFDGRKVTECGFHLIPENLSAVQGTSGSLTQLGTYQYCVVYEYTDNNGQVHRSAPSIPLTVTLTGANDSVDITVSTPRLSERKSSTIAGKGDIKVKLYRTENLGTIFYKLNINTTYTPGVHDEITLSDTASDATIIAFEPLYTTGGELENIAPPNAKFVTEWGRRVVLGGTEDNALWPSKIRTENKPIEFNDQLIITPSTLGGEITGLSVLDEKLIIFREERIEYITGEGPNNAGSGNPFSQPVEITNDLGCINAKSIVGFPGGLFFQSTKGFYILDSSLRYSYVGRAVKYWDTASVARANLLSDRNQIRVTLTSGYTLVLRYEILDDGRTVYDWMTFSSYAGRDAAVCDNQFYLSNTSGVPYKQDTTFDAGVSMAVGTPWIALGEIEGFQRVREFVILGNYKSSHTLTIKIRYDYSPAVVQTLTWPSSNNSSLAAILDSDYYGVSAFGGTVLGTEILRVRPARQKCSAIQIEISDGTLGGSFEGLELTGISFLIAVKKGLHKMRAIQAT